jgi:hypothetical protein
MVGFVMRYLFLLFMFLFSFQVFAQEERPRVVAVMPFIGPNAATFRDQLLPILDTDTRLLLTAPEPVALLAKKYGYELSDLFAGDGVQIVARDSKLDGVIVGKVERVSGKYQLSLRVYDGGTGLSLYSVTFTLPKQLLRQGEKEKLSGELLEALQEARLSIAKTEPEEKKPTKTKKPKKEPKPKPSKPIEVEEEETPAEEPVEETSEDNTGERVTRLGIQVGPVWSGRFSTLRITDDAGNVDDAFESSNYVGPGYPGIAVQASYLPLASAKRGRAGDFLVLNAGFVQSFLLAANLEVEGVVEEIQNNTNELFVGAKLQVPVKNSQFALAARYTRQTFAYVLPQEPAEQARLQTALNTQGFVDMVYQMAEIGPELKMNFANNPSMSFSAAAYADVIFSFGNQVLESYGETRSALGGRLLLGVAKKLGDKLQANIDLQGRLWNSAFQGGGTLLDGRPSKLSDASYETSVRLNYTDQPDTAPTT